MRGLPRRNTCFDIITILNNHHDFQLYLQFTMSSNDSDSDDDLGLFSFANKKAIVSTPPASPTKSENDESPIVTDRSLFMRNNKRKRLEAPLILEETVDQTVENENDTSLTSIIEDSNAISEKIRHYDNIVASIW